MENNALEIAKLSVEFNARKGALTTLSDLDLTIAPGETLCLLGESGSGKTITSLAVMRLIEYENGRITEGAVLRNGRNLLELGQEELRKERGSKIAMIFQEPMTALDPVFTIGHQLKEILLHHRQATRQEASRRAIALLERVGISEPALRMKQYPHEFSGGMLQRVMIAMAIACGPELLIADEPTTALDVTIQAQILRLLLELQKEYKMSILLITHDLGVAAEMADRVAVMYAGKIVEIAEARSLFAKPLHPYSRGLLQSITTLESDRSKPLYSIPGAIPSLSDLPSGCRFHPRCPFASDLCRTEEPPPVKVDSGMVACWHSEQIAELPLAYGHQTDSDLELYLLEEDRQSEILIEARNVTKQYFIYQGFFSKNKRTVHALDGVSLQIYKGETLGLVGESGSGKSTLARVLLQLEKATSGEIHWEDRNLLKLNSEQVKSLRQEMQMVFQDPYGSLNSRWKVMDIIGEPLRVHRSLAVSQRIEKVKALLQLVGLDPGSAERYPHEFSGGQRQRIGIARAIALEPKFIVLDEPVSALDVSVQAQIINLLQDLQSRLGLSYLFIAHGLHVVRHLAHRVGVMYLGQLVELAPTERLFASPAHPYTHALMSAIPVPDPTKKSLSASLSGEVTSPSRLPQGCRFHPRCSAATEQCRVEAPNWRTIGPAHRIACHHPIVKEEKDR